MLGPGNKRTYAVLGKAIMIYCIMVKIGSRHRRQIKQSITRFVVKTGVQKHVFGLHSGYLWNENNTPGRLHFVQVI